MSKGTILAKRVVEITFVFVLMIGLVTGVTLVQRQQSLTGSAGFTLADSEPPSVEILLPEEGFTVKTGAAPFYITVNAADESTVSSLELMLDNTTLTSCAGNFCQIEVEPETLNVGIHSISITATDSEGNSNVARRSFSVR